jgi:hypothetical protein
MTFRVKDPFWAVPASLETLRGVMKQRQVEGGSTLARWAQGVEAQRNGTIHEEDQSDLMNRPD